MGRKAGITRDDVINTAAMLADRDGLAEVSLAGIAAELGVRSPSLYAHTDGLDDVRRELTLRGAARLGLALDTASRGSRGEAALKRLAAAYREFALQHPGLYAAAQQAQRAAQDPVVTAALDAAVQPALRALAGVGVPPARLVHVARVFRSALHGFVELERGGGFGLPESVDESFNALVELLCDGCWTAAQE